MGNRKTRLRIEDNVGLEGEQADFLYAPALSKKRCSELYYEQAG